MSQIDLDTPRLSDTELGLPHMKLFQRGVERPQIDLCDPFVVAELAEQILNGRARGVTMVSTEQTHALAALAYCAFLPAARAVDLQMLSDADAPKAELRGALTATVEAGREFSQMFAKLAVRRK